MTSEDYKAIIRRWVDTAWNQSDFSMAEGLYPSTYGLHMSGGLTFQGADGITGFIRMYRAAFPDLRMTLEDMIAADDKVVWRVTTTGTQTGPLMGIPPSGKSIQVSTIIISRFANGQWVEDWANNDDLALLQQIGVIPAPEAAVA